MSRSDLYHLVRDLRQYLEWQAAPLTGAVPASAEARAEFEQTQQRRAEEKLRAAIEAPAPEAPPLPVQASAVTRAPEQTNAPNALWKSATFGSRPKPTFQAPAPVISLESIRAELGACERCGRSGSRQNIVFGVGNSKARLMFIGAAPDARDDREAEPFVGDAGELLDKMIGAMGLRREDVYLTNIVKCRAGADPTADEVAACKPFLTQQIAAVSPEVIVALGDLASAALLGTNAPLSRIRGKWQSHADIAVMPTFHPAELLQTASLKRDAWNDLKQVMARLGLR